MSTPLPSDELPAWGAGWTVGLRLWVERAGQAVLGKGRLELLEAIDRCRSISAAARQLGMSYRRAWQLVQSANEAAGKPLVVAAPGGVQGGGAHLTPRGRWAVAVFREMQDHLNQSAAASLQRLLDAPAAGLHVAAAVSLQEVLGRLLTDFALQQPTIRARAVFGASDELADRLLAGAPADLFLTADPRQLDRLRSGHGVRPGPAATLAENGLAAIGPADQAPAARRPADLARAGGPRVALADPASPLGGYTRAYLESLQLYDRLRGRAVLVESSRAVVTAVRAGQAGVGLVYSSDAAGAAGCLTLFQARRLPVPIRYTGAVLGRGAEPAAARTLLDFLTSPAAARRFRQCGFHPPRAGT